MNQLRKRCCVIFCQRTIGADLPADAEWICGQHWKLIPKRYKLLLRRVTARYRRGAVAFRLGAYHHDKHYEAMNRVWKKCKNQAIKATL